VLVVVEGEMFPLLELRLLERRRSVSFVPERRKSRAKTSQFRRQRFTERKEIGKKPKSSPSHPTQKQPQEGGKVSVAKSKPPPEALKMKPSCFLLLLRTRTKDQVRKAPHKESDPRESSKRSVEGSLLPSPASSSHSTNCSKNLH